jgi:F-box protein 39
LLGNLRGLRTLSVEHLLLDARDADGLLDDVAENCRDTLQSVQLLNITRLPNASIVDSIADLPYLSRLTVSVQQLTNDSLLTIAQHCPNLEHLCLVEDAYTVHCSRSDSQEPNSGHFISSNTWRQVTATLPRLRLRLAYLQQAAATDDSIARDDDPSTTTTMTLQPPEAPVQAVELGGPYPLYPTPSLLTALADRHADTLKAFGVAGGGAGRRKRRGWRDRMDTDLVEFVRRCGTLRRLVIRDTVSTATLIVLASVGQGHLEELVVRRNAVILRCDWPREERWSDEFYARLRTAARSYDETEREISSILTGSRTRTVEKYCSSWTMLPDRLFRRVRV